MEGVELDSQATPVMSEQELRVCEVYDQLQELQLSIALLRAQGVLSKSEPESRTFFAKSQAWKPCSNH